MNDTTKITLDKRLQVSNSIEVSDPSISATENCMETHYFKAGKLDDFKTDKRCQMFPIQIPDSNKRVNIVNKNGKYFATLNVCPHQGAPLHKGIADVEDTLTCFLHGWSFDLSTGECRNNRFVLDIFDVKIEDDYLWISYKPTNQNVKGNRRDFMGNELIYNPQMGWI